MDTVGKRFAPTDSELTNHYLRLQNLGKNSQIKNVISVVNICNHDPTALPSLAKLKSGDPIWYYFQLKEFLREDKRRRATMAGYWKISGKPRFIKATIDGPVIGTKHTVVYYENGDPDDVLTDWVIHEYDITSLPDHQRKYVLCKLMYKGKDITPFAGGGTSSVSDHNMVSGFNNSNMTPMTITWLDEPPQAVHEENINNNNNHGVQYLDDPNVVNAFGEGFTMLSDNYFNNMSPATRTLTQVPHNVQERNIHGFYTAHSAMEKNQHVDRPPFFNNNSNNYNHDVRLDDPNVVKGFNDGFMMLSDNFNNMSASTRTPTQVPQSVQEGNIHGSYANHLPMEMNQHVNFPRSYVLDGKTFFNNNICSMQVEAPYATNELEGRFMFSSDNNNLNMQPRTRYGTHDLQENYNTWEDMNTFYPLYGVGQQKEKETNPEPEEINTNSFFSDNDGNMELEAP